MRGGSELILFLLTQARCATPENACRWTLNGVVTSEAPRRIRKGTIEFWNMEKDSAVPRKAHQYQPLEAYLEGS